MVTYNVYRDGVKVASGLTEKTYTDTDLTPNTAYTYQVSAENRVGESDLSESVEVTTLPISVTGVSVSPQTSTAEAGTEGFRQLTVTIQPENATNQNVTFTITPEATGLTVNQNGRIEWTEETPAGEYVTEIRTEDGGHTATHSLTLTEPEPPEDPEEPEDPEN